MALCGIFSMSPEGEHPGSPLLFEKIPVCGSEKLRESTMLRLILRRLLAAIPTLLVVTIISFGIMKAAPGDPVRMYVAGGMSKGSSEDIERIRHNLGLDRPIHVQYYAWLRNAVQGNLGYSLSTRRPVIEVIGEKLPASLSLMGISFLLSMIIGVSVGVLSAARQYSLFDYGVTIFAFLGNSLPSFWIAMMLIWLFAVELRWLPTGHMSSYETTSSPLLDSAKHYVLPVITLSLVSLVSWVRYQRASMLESLRQDYVRTARAKGLSEGTVRGRHAWRNSLIPIATLIGFSVANLVAGSYIIETIFSWPGLGQLGFDALLKRDYPVMMGVALLSAIFILVGNLIADVTYILIDPRIRES
jgi:peptide/nickel transport system permease protein